MINISKLDAIVHMSMFLERNLFSAKDYPSNVTALFYQGRKGSGSHEPKIESKGSF